MFSYVNDRGGQAPALRARKGVLSPCAVRDQAIPNYSHYNLANHNNLVNPAQNPAHFFNLTKTRKNGIINTMFNFRLFFTSI